MLVVWITVVTMVVEIVAGWLTNSMALLADGFHMSSHAVAIGLSAFAYGAARRYAHDPRFAFGTWKIEVLGGFASAILLLAVAALMVWGSIERLLSPQPIHYAQAMLVAVIGLVVNLVSARILGAAHRHHGHGDAHGHDHGHDHHGHDHAHGHGHGHAHDHAHGSDAAPMHGQHGHASDHPHGHASRKAAATVAPPDHPRHQDLNLRSAYMHVIVDAATSVAAIVALAAGWAWGWAWLDPAIGIVGAVLVALWAKGLILDTGKVLLDCEMDDPVVGRIRAAVAERGAATDTSISDLHVWRVGRRGYSCAIGLVTHDDAVTPDDVRRWLSAHDEIVHSTIEIQRCRAG
jgi:cation diffusion facilitator family transporter